MERAKDLNGLLTIIAAATRATGAASAMLSERNDTESQMQRAALRQTRDELEFIGRDLAGGVIDLRELPFDERSWSLLFRCPVIPLASDEPEPREPAHVPAPPSEVQDDLFDFDSSPGDHGIGIPPDLLDGIEVDDEIAYDDCPTLVMEL